MKISKIFYIIAFIGLAMVSCKNEAKKEDAPKVDATAKVQEASFAISGMTCEIGCAKKIASDLAKKEGVLDAKVVFADSIATVKYDANKTNKADLMTFVDGIAENMYKTSDVSKKACNADCKKECCTKADADKKACSVDCKKECCTKKEAKTACATDSKKECCSDAKKA